MQRDERCLTVAVSLGVGVPGIISFVTERAIAYEHARALEFRNNTVSTPIGYACFSTSVEHRGFEYGFCAPYLSYGRNHPRYGDRLSLFIPLVCALQVTREGSMGVTVQLPLFLPFLGVGVTVFVKHPRFASLGAHVLDRADRAFVAACRVFRRKGSCLPAPGKRIMLPER